MPTQDNLTTAQSALKNLPRDLPADKQLKAMGAALLPMLESAEEELGPWNELAETLTDLAQEQLTEQTDLGFMLASAIIVPTQLHKFKAYVEDALRPQDPDKYLKKAKFTQENIRRLGQDKVIAMNLALRSVLPASITLFEKKTKKAQHAEYDRIMTLTPEDLAAEYAARAKAFPVEAVIKALDRLEEKLTGPVLKEVAQNLANGLKPEHTETLLCSGTGFLRDLFENAANNRPFTISNVAQGKEFAKSLKQAFTMVEQAFVDAGITEDTGLAATLKKARAAQKAPKNAPVVP